MLFRNLCVPLATLFVPIRTNNQRLILRNLYRRDSMIAELDLVDMPVNCGLIPGQEKEDGPLADHRTLRIKRKRLQWPLLPVAKNC